VSLEGIVFVLISALCNSSWNLLSKTGSGPIVFIRQALRFSAVCYLPVWLYLQQYVHYDANFLRCVLSSGLMMGLFFFALSSAYQHGHISVTYPITRAVPILLVVWATIFMGEWPSQIGSLGMVLVMAGCFILPLGKFSFGVDGLNLQSYWNKSCLWALVTAIATAGFSLIDKHAAISLHGATSGELICNRLNYVYLQHVIAWLIFEGATRKLPYQPRPGQRPREVLAGLLFLVSYCMIVLALVREPLSYVVAFRQISILITSVVSMICIEKHAPRTRLAGLCAVFVGVVLVGVA